MVLDSEAEGGAGTRESSVNSGERKATALKALRIEALGQQEPLLAALFELMAEAEPPALESHTLLIDWAQRLRDLQHEVAPNMKRLLERGVDVLLS